MIAAVILCVLRMNADKYILDGPGMVYTWTDYQLKGSWEEVNTPENCEPITLTVKDNTIEYKCGERIKTFGYSISDDVDPMGVPEGEVYLRLEDCDEYESLIFHMEESEEGGVFPVLSGTLFEYDGRGEIVICEFVPSDQIGVPENFESETARVRNNAEPVTEYAIVSDESFSEDQNGEGEE